MRSYFIVCILLVQQVFVAFTSALPHLLSFDDYVHAIYERQNFTEEEDFESIKEALQEAYATPLDLNKVTAEALAALGILSNNQIKNYFNHLANTGPLYAKYELQAIPDFDLTTIALLLPFVYVLETYHVPSDYLPIPSNNPNHFLFRYTPDLSATALHQLPRLGNLDKCTVQLAFNHSNAITWGITARKQAGESFCWDHTTYRYGFNLWSVFAMVNNKKYIKRMIIGDYQIGYGQGLLLSAGYIHTGDAISSIIRSNHLGIRPYNGIKRIGLRGIAITSDLGPIELTGFYANNNLDATLQLNANNQLYTNRIDYIGKYDTSHNLAKKGTINEQVVGCTIRKQYHRNQTEVGMNLLYDHYDIPIIAKEDARDPYWVQTQSAASLFYRLLWKNWMVFGEAGLTWPNSAGTKKGKALITGCMLSLSRYLDLSGALYYYGKGLYTPYGNAFKRYATDRGNEQGAYVCLQLTPVSSWHIATSGHFFATLFPKKQLAIPSRGHRFTTRAHHTWNRATILVLQHKLHKHPRNKPKAVDGTDGANIEWVIQNNIKCKIDHKLTHYWWTHSEVQWVRYTFLEQTHHGYGLASTQKWQGRKYKFSFKLILFQSHNYVTRLYFYLPNPLYSGTQFYPYYGNGIAINWLVCWKPISSVRLEMQYNFIYSFDDSFKKEADKINGCSPKKGKHHGTIQFLVRF